MGTNLYWATLMPIFSPQPKHIQTLYELLVYIQHEHKIEFSSSVLEAMKADAPVDTISSLLQSSTWDGPQFFTDYIFENVPTLTTPGSITPATAAAISSVKPIHFSQDVKEQLQNEFLLNCGLYIKDPSAHLNIPGLPLSIIPNPDFNLAGSVMDSSWGTIHNQPPINFVATTGEEFYQLLGPDNYGFSTTLIFPNQALVDEDVPDDDEDEEEKKKKPNPFNPAPITKTPWDPTKNPYGDKPSPYPYPKEKAPYDYSHSGASAADYKKYKEGMIKKGHEDDNWPGHDKYGDYNK